jgi:late competence protein required for DNA uptake (superfamily II DNA/RNA helicase)
MRRVPARAICARCGNRFSYMLANKPRMYCDACLPLERFDNNKFSYRKWYLINRDRLRQERAARAR